MELGVGGREDEDLGVVGGHPTVDGERAQIVYAVHKEEHKEAKEEVEEVEEAAPAGSPPVSPQANTAVCPHCTKEFKLRGTVASERTHYWLRHLKYLLSLVWGYSKSQYSYLVKETPSVFTCKCCLKPLTAEACDTATEGEGDTRGGTGQGIGIGIVTARGVVVIIIIGGPGRGTRA